MLMMMSVATLDFLGSGGDRHFVSQDLAIYHLVLTLEALVLGTGDRSLRNGFILFIAVVLLVQLKDIHVISELFFESDLLLFFIGSQLVAFGVS